MNAWVSLLSPLIYLVIGLLLGKTAYNIKGPASSLLTKLVIPLVIIINIATHPSGTFEMILGMMAVMLSLLLIYHLSFYIKNKLYYNNYNENFNNIDVVDELCFFYLNIGWLGLPIATMLYGESAANVIIAAYVGNSLFGNSVSVGLMMTQAPLKQRLLATLKSPPVYALGIGLICMYIIPIHMFIKHNSIMILTYTGLKLLMSFLGMSILGMWLAKIPLQYTDFYIGLKRFMIRSSIVFLLFSLLIEICIHYNVQLIINNKPTIYLMCLLPPAANIVVLETYYMKTGRSATLIASGTCISIIAIMIYIAITQIVF